MKNKNNSVLYSAIVIIIVLISVVSGKVGGSKDKKETTEQTTEIASTKTTVTEEKSTTNEASEGNGTEETVYEEKTEEAVNDDRPLTFKNVKRLNEHYDKHGVEMGFASAKDYEAAARRVVLDKEALHKTEAEDGDDVYYLERTNEFVIVSPEGYIRTYFNPSDGINYYNRQ